MDLKKKILLISPVIPFPPTDGGRLRTYKLCKALADKYDITLIARIGPDDRVLDENDIGDVFKRIILVEEFQEDLSSERLSSPSFIKKLANKIREWVNPWQGMPYGLSYSVDPQIKKALEDCLEKDDFDLIHVEHLYMSQYVTDIKNIPLVLTEHNIEYEKYKGFLKYESSIRQGKIITNILDSLIQKCKVPIQLVWLKHFESSLSRTFKSCLTVSEADKKRLNALNPGLYVEVVPNGVDTVYFTQSKEEAEGLTLSFTGHMGYLPNEDAMLNFVQNIFPKIVKNVPEVRLNIIGKHPSKRLIMMTEGDTRIKVTGAVDDVRPYMCSGQVYIVPLRMGSGTRLKILEAMAMEMAVVSTTIGCEGLDVEHDKNIIIADEPEEFALRVIELLNNPEKCQQLGHEGRKLVVGKYDWKDIAKRQDHVYQKVLK